MTGIYQIKTMTRDEVDIAVDWAADEGWNPGLGDADCYYTADPDGFLIGLLDGEPIATISVVKYGETFGFLGFYIVKPEYRGQGFGIQIWDAGMHYLDGRNVGLDGVLDQQSNYKKSGFKLAYSNIRFEGSGGGDMPGHEDVIDLVDLPFETVQAYDLEFFPEDRTNFLRCWLKQPQGRALGMIQDGELAGYGVIRPCRNGHKIGPLFADCAEVAEILYSSLTKGTPENQPIYLDVPEVNTHAVAMAVGHGMQRVFETARMYTKAFPDLPLERQFGVTTFELG